MKYAFAQVAFGLGANALVARDHTQQCYQLKASGGASGVLGQLDDGQNRIGGGNPTGCYCLADGGFTDTSGSGCILTPPTTQFQCDAGATPTTGFAVGKDGGVTYNGSGKFYACPVNDKGEYNVYSQPLDNMPKCVEISLSSAGLCGPSKPAPSSKPAPKPSKQPVYTPKPQPTPSACPVNTITVVVTETEKEKQPAYTPKPQPSKPAQPEQPKPQPSKPAQPEHPKPQPSMKPGKPAGSCPADLNGNYQYPHLIVPVDSSSPHSAPGTSYNGKVNPHTCSIFNFDIPQSYAGKTCSVVFLFPEQKDLETSSYTVSGHGQCSFSKLAGNANQQTSWENAPKKEKDLGSMEVQPGNEYVIASGDCAAGQTVTYEMCSSGDYSMEYFQDYNPSPIGMYVRQC